MWCTGIVGRATVFLLVGLVTCILLFSPLVADEPCEDASSLDGYKHDLSPRDLILTGRREGDVVPIGAYWANNLVSGALLAVFLDPEGCFNSAEVLHRWVRNYAACVVMQSVCSGVAVPLTLAFCPEQRALFIGLANAGMGLFFMSSQIILLYITRLRLEVLAENSMPRALTRARCSLKVFVGLTFLFIPVVLLNAIESLRPILYVLAMLIMLAITFVWGSFQANAVLEFQRAAFDVVAEVRHMAVDAKARIVAQARAAYFLLIASGVTTLLVFIALLIITLHANTTSSSNWHLWLWEVSILLDTTCNSCLALVCAGLVGPAGDRMEELAEVGRLAMKRRERLIYGKLEAIRPATTGRHTSFLAGMLESAEPALLLGRALNQFRAIAWSALSARPEIVVGGGPIDQLGPGSADLYNASRCCQFGCCNFFLSHSWHDNAQLKWMAMMEFCNSFEATSAAPMRLWLDKVCIDQANIKMDLQCLPIYLGACNSLLLICGDTYVSRLWCCLELFVYFEMTCHDEGRPDPVVLTIGDNEADHQSVRDSFLRFDVEECTCHDPSDLARILVLISSSSGIEDFNKKVKSLADLFGNESEGEGADAPQLDSSNADDDMISTPSEVLSHWSQLTPALASPCCSVNVDAASTWLQQNHQMISVMACSLNLAGVAPRSSGTVKLWIPKSSGRSSMGHDPNQFPELPGVPGSPRPKALSD